MVYPCQFLGNNNNDNNNNNNDKNNNTLLTMVGDYMNIMNTTFDLNFILIKIFNNMDTQKHGNYE